METPAIYKTCKICNQSKQIDEFYSSKLTKDGRHSYCKLCHRLKSREFQRNNKSKTETYKQNWESKNKEKITKWKSEYYKKYNETNKDRRRELKLQWDKKAMLNPLHRLSNNLRGNMYHALKGKKGFRKWESLVGYSLQDLINHLTPLLNETMTWENYGTEWHVDHITPKSWFKYQSTDDPKFKECWALSNLQPKLKIDNIRKGNRFIG